MQSRAEQSRAEQSRAEQNKNFRKWKIFNNHLACRVSILLLGFMLASPALAARILVLTTNETDSAAIIIQDNCIQEFQNSGAATVDVKADILNTGTLTAADFAPTAGGYDIVAICTVYNTASTANALVIQNAAQTRAAQAFFIFEDAAGVNYPVFSVMDAAKVWTLNHESATGTRGHSTQLNTVSKYHTDFLNLNPYRLDWYYPFSNVPVDNALYLPPGAPTPASGSTVTASAIFVPPTESYQGNGACLFYTADASVFAASQYSSSINGNQGKIADAALKAITLGSGACFMAPAAPLSAAVPANSKGWLLALAALLTMMTALGLGKRRA
jgi:hypothetical protein